jgi:hypothetical protein
MSKKIEIINTIDLDDTMKEYKSRFSDNFIINKYVSSREVRITFVTYPHSAIVRSCVVHRGSVKNPYYPAVAGTGYLGTAAHGFTQRGGKTKPSYTLWSTMILNCYNKDAPMYKTSGGKGKSVCEAWYSYKNFDDWYNLQDNAGKPKMALTCSTLVQNNKVYSPPMCAVIPNPLHSMLTEEAGGVGLKNNTLPRGVIARVGKGGTKYISKGCKKGQTNYLGTFDTTEQAQEAYKSAKKQNITEAATLHHEAGNISDSVYNSLLSWEI